MKHLARLFLLALALVAALPVRAQLAQGLVVDPLAPPTLTVGKTYPLLITTEGKLFTNATGGGGGGGGSITFSTPQSVRFSNGSAWVDVLPISVSALPLPSGAATAANQIAGGPQTGSGVITATTQRVTLATDGPTVLNLADIAAKTPALVGNNSDAEASVSSGLQPTEAYQMVYNGSTWDRVRGTNGSQNISAPAALDISYSTIITPPTSNLLNTTGTVQAEVTPGGVYTLCVSIDNATLGTTANTLASCGTTAFNGSNLSASKVVTYTGTAPQVGQLLAGTGISPGSYVVSVSAGVSFTMNLPATATGTVTLNVTAGAFAGGFQASPDGSSWTSANVTPRTYSVDQSTTTGFVAPGLWQWQAGPTDRFIRFNLTSINATGVAGNLTGNPRLRFNIDALDRAAGRVNLPYVGYVAATAATFPTGIPVVMPVDCDGLSEVDVDYTGLAGTSQTVTWRQTNDENGVLFQGLYSTTTHVAQNTAAITVNALGNYRIAPAARFFYAAMTGGSAVSANAFGGVIAKVGVQPAIQAVHITTNNVPANISQVGGTSTVTGGLAGTFAIGGAAAHSAATTTNPTTIGGRVVPTTIATVDTTLVAGDAAHLPITPGQQAIMKPYGTAELDWAGQVSLTPTVWASASTPTVIRSASGTANVRTYVTSIQLQTDALGGATNLWILDGAVAVTSVTIATPGVFTNSGTNDFKAGDMVIFQNLGTITGITANTPYYVTATSLAATTFTVSSTIGGTALQITGSTSTPTVYRVLHQTRLQTTALPLTPVALPTPIRTAPNVALSILSSSTQTGTIYAAAQGNYLP